MLNRLTIALISLGFAGNSLFAANELQEESDIRFAFYSSSWGGNNLDKIRLLAYNSTADEVTLEALTFLKSEADNDEIDLQLNLAVPAGGYAELELDYVDLLQNNECISRTMEENWRLAEISNYTLNPSVRNLIIEDTDSFRIYQCVESIRTQIQSAENQQIVRDEWVLYHFERKLEL